MFSTSILKYVPAPIHQVSILIIFHACLSGVSFIRWCWGLLNSNAAKTERQTSNSIRKGVPTGAIICHSWTGAEVAKQISVKDQPSGIQGSTKQPIRTMAKSIANNTNREAGCVNNQFNSDTYNNFKINKNAKIIYVFICIKRTCTNHLRLIL